MGILAFLSRRLGLTPNEGRIFLFLIAGLAAGGMIKWYLGYTGAGPHFDYRAQDSIFTSRSALALQDSLPGEFPDAKAPHDSIVNINTAGKDALMMLPAVGESIAVRILDYRRTEGLFKKPEDLLNVRGIGKKKFEQIAPFITVH